MSTRHFVPEVWSKALLHALYKNLIFAQPGIVNRDYEGEIREAGDTVRITSLGRPSIGKYIPGKTKITPQALASGQRTLVVDQADYWAFEVDDIDQRQSQGNFIPDSVAEAAYAQADEIDQYVAGHHTFIPTAQRVRPVPIGHNLQSPELQDQEYRRVYDDMLVPMKVMLDELNVPTAGRYVTASPWIHGALIRDARFVENDKSADPSTLRNGQVGRAAGFDILISNNTPEVAVSDANGGGMGTVMQAGTDRAITFAEQINKVEAYRPESAFADAMKGLTLYGAKVIRPDSLVAATAVRRERDDA